MKNRIKNFIQIGISFGTLYKKTGNFYIGLSQKMANSHRLVTFEQTLYWYKRTNAKPVTYFRF